AVLTLLAEDRINVGRLHLEGRRAGARIGELVDAAQDRADRPAPPSHPQQPGALPRRTTAPDPP
ncbi:MAG TPA: hypothetical protein VN520_27995, partial [Streptomyces sp.]|nr:hypothetical protein [Streptomyces sp.]